MRLISVFYRRLTVNASRTVLPKLHLGCGQKYLAGYVNIDYPLSEHSVQQSSVADQYSNLLELQYPAESIAEVRLHHVFEHFSRPAACALLASWNAWLEPGGLLRIEVPDFERMAKIALSRRSDDAQKALALRHVFGSQEAAWALHQDGYTGRSLRQLVKYFEFKPIALSRNHWRGTHNIEIEARKVRQTPPRDKLRDAARSYLSRYQVDGSVTEERMLDIWMSNFDHQLAASMPE